MADKKVKETKVKKDKSKKESAPAAAEKDVKIPSRLFDYYHTEIVPGLMKTFSYKNIMQVPKIEKVVVNMGLGAAVTEPKILEEAVKELESKS
jgi:large subunit ribosomal protein L5